MMSSSRDPALDDDDEDGDEVVGPDLHPSCLASIYILVMNALPWHTASRESIERAADYVNQHRTKIDKLKKDNRELLIEYDRLVAEYTNRMKQHHMKLPPSLLSWKRTIEESLQRKQKEMQHNKQLIEDREIILQPYETVIEKNVSQTTEQGLVNVFKAAGLTVNKVKRRDRQLSKEKDKMIDFAKENQEKNYQLQTDETQHLASALGVKGRMDNDPENDLLTILNKQIQDELDSDYKQEANRLRQEIETSQQQQHRMKQQHKKQEQEEDEEEEEKEESILSFQALG